MVTFKDYLLEYANRENAFFSGISKLKVRTKEGIFNGKDMTRAHLRKHKNHNVKEYDHKHPIINSICQGKANNVLKAGVELTNLLNLYNMVFEPGVKTIGNSNVEIEMYEDEERRQYGKLRAKTPNTKIYGL